MIEPTNFSIDKVASLTSAELDQILGEHILAQSFQSKPSSAGEARAAGANYFEETLPSLRAQICANATLKAMFGPQAKDRNTILLAIADLVTHLTPIPLVLAARIIHFGYDRLCPPES